MRYQHFFPVAAALSLALAIPGRLAAQATDSTKSAASAQTVTCKDGTTSQKGQGACSHHGGMVRMVSCKDGTMSKRGRGACSHHGGVVTRHASAARTSSSQTRSSATNSKTNASTTSNAAKGDTTPGDSAATAPNR
jgi:hypothetical protein